MARMPRADGPTRHLIWSAARLVAYSSSVTTLFPGDVIATGIPRGVGPIRDGDTVEVTIDRAGTLPVTVSAAGTTACPNRGATAFLTRAACRGRVPPPPPA